MRPVRRGGSDPSGFEHRMHTGFGIGGFLVIIGFGLFINSLFSHYPQPMTPAPPPRQEPPQS